MIDYYAPNIDLTLLGCGFLLHYHMGATYLLSQVWPHRPFNRICGASSGGLMALFLASGISYERIVAEFRAVMDSLREFIRKPTHKLVSVHEKLKQLMVSGLPQDAHRICSNRLGISITKLWPRENIFACQFESRQDLIDAVAAGCFIPLWSGSLEFPKYKGLKCLDGGYTNNMPKFPDLNDSPNQDQTDRAPADPLIRHVTVCAFASDTDICPPYRHGISFRVLGTVYYCNWRNFSNSMPVLIPFDSKVYRQCIINGHQDMKNFILDNNMVKCQQCVWIKAPQDVRSSCLSCLKLMEKVDNLKIPQHWLAY